MSQLLRKARLAVTPRSWLLKRTLSNGAVVCGRNRSGHGGRGVYVLGDALEPELQHLQQLLGPDDVFMDIGANTGVFALKAAKHLREGVVVAVEPGIEAFGMLCRNVELNRAQNVRVRNLCVAQRTGVQTLWLNRDKPNSFGLAKAAPSACAISVLGVCLDDLCDWEGLDRVDYIKIDVVGAEAQALAGAARIKERFRPIFQIAEYGTPWPPPWTDYEVYRTAAEPRVNRVLVPKGDRRARRFEELGWARCAL